MRYRIVHTSPDRVHLALARGRLSPQEADILYYALLERRDVIKVQVFARTGEVAIRFRQSAEELLGWLDSLSLSGESGVKVPAVSARADSEHYKEKIIGMLLRRFLKRTLLPVPLRTALTVYRALPFLWHGLRDLAQGRFGAEIIHASAIGASLLIRDFPTADSITFLTELGEVLEEWTYKKSVDDLAQSLALNISKVWKVGQGADELADIEDIAAGDRIRITMGNMIPLDGIAAEGEAMVNQAALTGEPLTVRKIPGRAVFAGTVVEEGELVVEVREVSGQTRYDKIIQMIEESERMTPAAQSQAERVVKRMIPYTFGTAVLTWLLTRNVTKAASVLMVDFSCAIEVAMPVATLSAMSEANRHRLTVKGGKFLEAISAADTIVFDKTGTLTRATPCVEQVVAMEGRDPEEMLRIAACLEEHFPHSLANAVVRAAVEKGLRHEEMHSKPEYIVAHGIVSTIGEGRVVLGSWHFIFDVEGVPLLPEDEERLEAIPEENSRLFLAIDGHLAAVIGIADPVKEEAVEVIARLKGQGIRHVVMMTGDSHKTAAAVAARAGITEFYAEVLPEDKARYVEEQKAAGRKVIMVGDGINDSPALSAADVGIAMKEGADIAQEISDVTVSGDALGQLVVLKQISDRLMPRMRSTARVGIGFNGAILLAGLLGLVTPGTAAFLHNASTIGLSLYNMTPLVEEKS
ncbi:MAG: heavy metal translocating P-type ATPase [Oscillospiraceae bacterium]|nr:heavy metal translocating P-type ATPase [Oscillospiraceae bacterium]